jgi:hypothetical protein
VSLAEPAKAASLQITRGELPLSADALRLRSLKRDLRRLYETQGDFSTVAAYSLAYQHLMVDEVRPLDENRHGLVVEADATQASGRAEREAALAMIERHDPGSERRLTLGADKGYDTAGFVAECRGCA